MGTGICTPYCEELPSAAPWEQLYIKLINSQGGLDPTQEHCSMSHPWFDNCCWVMCSMIIERSWGVAPRGLLVQCNFYDFFVNLKVSSSYKQRLNVIPFLQVMNRRKKKRLLLEGAGKESTVEIKVVKNNNAFLQLTNDLEWALQQVHLVPPDAGFVCDTVPGPLTCFHGLPAQGEGAACLQVVGGDGTVVVSCRTPWESGCAFCDFLHDDHPRWAWGTYRKSSGYI